MGTIPDRAAKLRNALRWAPAYYRQSWFRQEPSGRCHLIFGLADHFEPSILPGQPGKFADRALQEQRLERWCRAYPRALGAWRDHEGFAFRHTYFFPAEQYDRSLLDHLADHCHAGWGEVEIHLHHGLQRPDTAENTRKQLVEFRDALAERHGCLSRWNGVGGPRYAFVHGNWALANSSRGHFCGVDDEMQILSETGCYADFTLPSAPSPAQVAKVNALYECALPLDQRAPHRHGRDLRSGCRPEIFPIIVQGPLAMVLKRGRPKIENAELSGRNPPTPARFARWRKAAIRVLGRPDWVFIKLHCHGMDPRDEGAMLGPQIQDFLGWLTGYARDNGDTLHFATAREMTNILLAACDGRGGNPGEYRDYQLRLSREAGRER